MSCNHDCKNCKVKVSCSEKSFFKNEFSSIKNIIGIMSGKGGVGKSTVTSVLASMLNKRGFKVGILDADITGPSIAKAFGLSGRVTGTNGRMYPMEKDGIKVMSINLLIQNEEDPVVWRGHILGNAIKQFYEETVWGELDFLLIDMPPGTSDIQLTCLNSIPLSSVIMVSSPQDLVKMIVKKAITLCNKTNVKILGLIENMAYVKCPCCDKKIEIYGKSKLNDVCLENHLIPLASLPINTLITEKMDSGNASSIEEELLENTIEMLTR